MLRDLTLIAIFMTAALHVFAQVGTAKSGVVRIIPADSHKIPGTGFIVKLDDRAAYILTASHVVEGGATPKVEFFAQRNTLMVSRVADGAEWGDDKGLALLIVDAPLPTGLSALPINPTAIPEEGEPIEVIGHPGSGGNWSVSKGYFTSRAGRVLYFDAKIDKGNSGGPLLHNGSVVGVVTKSGPKFGEAVSTLATIDFLNGSGIDLSIASTRTPSPTLLKKSQDASIADRAVGQVFKDCSDCPEMVVVPAGDFLMGVPESEQLRAKIEGLQHKVSIPRSLAIGRTEVTRAQFAHFVADTGHRTESGCTTWAAIKQEWSSRTDADWKNPGFDQSDDHPVVCVNWNDANAYAQWLAKRTGKSYRLLSEAEWEYAALAGPVAIRYQSNTESCKYANITDSTANRLLGSKDWRYADCDDGRAYTAPVRSYAPNGFGLYDVIGNVWEWTADCWNNSYSGAPSNGDAWSKGECSRRVLRGVSWSNYPGVAPERYRFRHFAGARVSDLGFRLARTD